MRFPELRPRQPLSGVALAAIPGIALADLFDWSLPSALAITALGCCATFFHPRVWTCWLLTALVFGSLHTLRHRHSDAQRLAAELAGGGQVVRVAGLVWSEPEKPTFFSRTISARFRLKVESLERNGRVEHPDAIMNLAWAGAMPAYGDRLECTADARNLEPPRNPGQLNFTAQLARQGIFTELTARFPEDCRIVDHGHGARAQLFAIEARHWMRRQLALGLDGAPEVVTLIESMVLGLRGETPEEVREMFQRTGTLHLFAVSGLNVAMLAAIAWFILKPLGIRRRPAVLIIIPILCGYALVTGLSASCVRATVMGALVLLALLCDRPPVVYNSLAAAALAILAWDTNQLFAPGFQFSFVLVFTIVWLARRIERPCARVGRPDDFLPRLLWSWPQRVQSRLTGLLAAALGVTLSAWVGSLLFTAGYFHLFSPAGILANLIAVPLAFAILALGVGTLLLASLWTVGAIWLNNANWLCAKALLFVVKMFALLPGGHLYVESPRLNAPECSATILDLGDGGAIHLRAGGQDWLLDCGHTKHYPRIVLPYLRSRGVNRLDGLLLTHGDAGHLGAAADILADFAPRLVVDSPLKDLSSTRRKLTAEMAAQKLARRLCRRGDRLVLSPRATLTVLYPPAGLIRKTADDKALVLRLDCGGRRVLFMSDSGFATEQWLLENEPDLRADLLVKGQHVRDFSGTADFIARVQPAAIICSAPGFGDDPRQLDPWVKTMRERGLAVFRQDECGAAQMEIRGGHLTVRGFIDGFAFTVPGP